MSNEELKQKVRNAKNRLELMQLFRMGFEFEFHRLNGQARQDLGGIDFEADYDADTLAANSWEAVCQVDDSEIIDCLPSTSIGKFLKGIFDDSNLTIDEIVKRASVSNDALLLRIINTLEDAQTAWRDDWESEELENNPENYYPAKDDEYELELDERLELGRDSSVLGGEIRTIGGLSLGQFYRALKSVFNKQNRWTIDEGCSMHIHLSIPGMRHKYGRNLQASMYEYLLNNIERLPLRVRERLASPAIKWCKPVLSEEKYTMVHFHDQGTWEFRLFGNVSSIKDAMACLLLACEAMQFAYQVQAGNFLPLLVRTNGDGQLVHHVAVSECLSKGKNLYAIFREQRINQHKGA